MIHQVENYVRSQYIPRLNSKTLYTVYTISNFGIFDSFLAGMVWEEIKCT